jgi:DNA-binding NtrC family response regulator
MTLIAVVDNEETIRTAMLRLLRGVGFQAEAYADGLEFLAAAEAIPCLAFGAAAYLDKSVDERLLLNAIAAALPPGGH